MLEELLTTVKVITSLVLREMSTTYGRSPGGYIWAIVEPVAGIGLLTAVFSFVAREPELGTSFPLFYASGLVPFMMYVAVQARVANSVSFSKQLLVYPRITYLDAVVARFILASLIQVIVAFLIFYGIATFSGVHIVANFQYLFVALSMALLLGLCVGTVNCLLFSLFPVWRSIWGIVNRPMFLVSGVFFTYDQVPDTLKRFLWYNPLIHVVGEMRAGIYPFYDGSYVSKIYVYFFCMIIFVVGLFFLRRYNKKVLNEM